MDYPPYINGALSKPLLVAREIVHIFGHQQSLMGRCGLPYSLCMPKISDKM